MGMTYEQFWEQDSWLVRYYRKAYEIKQEEFNRNAWLQGMYVYEAIADIAPILHAFAKKGTKARKYSEKPYEFKKPDKPTKRLSKRDAEAKAKSDKVQAMMLAFMKKQSDEKEKKRMKEIQKEAAILGITMEEKDGKVRIIEDGKTGREQSAQ